MGESILTKSSRNANHLSTCSNDGFTIQNVTEQVKKISININESDDKTNTVFKLVRAIIDLDLVHYTSSLEQDENNLFAEQSCAELFVVEPGLKYVNLDRALFKVHGEIITNDDLIRAVKNTFPERFI